jgi:hypothetical protein
MRAPASECTSDDAVDVRAERARREPHGAKSESRHDVVALWQLEVKAVLLCVPCCFVL